MEYNDRGFANSGARWKNQHAPKLEISNFLLIRAPVFLTTWRNSDGLDATRKLRKILEIQALRAFFELKKAQNYTQHCWAGRSTWMTANGFPKFVMYLSDNII